MHRRYTTWPVAPGTTWRCNSTQHHLGDEPAATRLGIVLQVPHSDSPMTDAAAEFVWATCDDCASLDVPALFGEGI